LPDHYVELLTCMELGQFRPGVDRVHVLRDVARPCDLAGSPAGRWSERRDLNSGPPGAYPLLPGIDKLPSLPAATMAFRACGNTGNTILR